LLGAEVGKGFSDASYELVLMGGLEDQIVDVGLNILPDL
jgi:hypothetical protein